MSENQVASGGTSWQGIACSPGNRRLFEATFEAATRSLLDKFGVKPTSISNVLEEQNRANLERQRAMLLCHVDEIEQALGYDNDPNKARTSQIRTYWKDSGRPQL
jgi:hypothetical protein